MWGLLRVRIRGITGAGTAGRETVRSYAMAKRKRLAEMTSPRLGGVTICSISWPVIDASFRYSMFLYGSLVCNAPFYLGLLQGVQKTDRSGSIGTWS